MDSLTQIVLGGAIGNALLGRKIKNRAVLYGAIAGTIPDLDVLSVFFTDPLTALEIHRGFTHSILFAITMPFFFGYLMYLLEKKRGVTYEEGYWLFFWGFFTHSILDVFTTWGTQLLWPFDYSFAFKSISVIDPLYTIPFIYFLVRSMRETTNLEKRMMFNKWGLYVSTGYLCLTLLLKAVAFYNVTDTLDKRHIAYKSLSIKPTAMNTILWRAIIEIDDAYLIGDYSFFSNKPIVFKEYKKNCHLVESLEQNPLIKRLAKISEGAYTFSEKDEHIYFNDLRFGVLKETETEVQFAFSYYFFLNDEGELEVAEVKKDKRDGVQLMKEIWYKIIGKN